MITYKSYSGTIDFDEDAGMFHGEVIGTRDVITFQGKNVTELRKAFRDSIDEYLAFCKERGEEPDKPFSGKFVLRISDELHRKMYIRAVSEGKSLNSWVVEKLERVV